MDQGEVCESVTNQMIRFDNHEWLNILFKNNFGGEGYRILNAQYFNIQYTMLDNQFLIETKHKIHLIEYCLLKLIIEYFELNQNDFISA